MATRLDLFSVRMPFSAVAAAAMDESSTGLGMAIPAEEPWEAGEFVLARLEDEDGREGWGEAFMWLPETGVSPSEILSSVPAALARYVLGRSPFDVRAMRARMDRNVTRNEVGKGLLDLACHELAARQVGRPVHDLIGGRGSDRLPLCGLVPLADPETCAAIAAGYVGAGYRTVRVKLGTGPVADRAVMVAVRDAVGPEVRLRVDYNQAYAPFEAVRALKAIEDLGIDAAEQPLPVGDLVGMVEVQRRTSIPLFLHEGSFSVSDVVTLVELGGCGVVGVNTERPGGLTGCLSVIDVAAARGMGVIVHNQPLGVGTAAHAHLAAARFDSLGHAVELSGDVMFAGTLVVDRPEVRDGCLVVPDGPGWGVEVDRDALDDHLAAPPTTVTVDDLRRPL
ncbi:MAG: mandelate racemase/muconate lactonizing enzyme family protein [Acidimicrobiales bacterium]|nr:mandelate racemase/muconate lactonizing enzyme family protein [Acidimicrobiales bacterium]